MNDCQKRVIEKITWYKANVPICLRKNRSRLNNVKTMINYIIH